MAAFVSSNPDRIGTTMSVADSTALAALPINGFTLGTSVFNVAVGLPFVLSLSSASLVTDRVVAVAGTDGFRWLIQSPSSVPTGTYVPTTQDTTNIDLAVNSTTDGGWRIWGFLNFGSVGSDSGVFLEPNAVTASDAVGGRNFATQGSSTAPVEMDSLTSSGVLDITKLWITAGGGNANRLFAYFRGEFLYHDGVGGFWTCDTHWMASPTTITSGWTTRQSQVWTGTDSAWTNLRIAATAANAIKFNGGTNPSWVRYQPLGFSA